MVTDHSSAQKRSVLATPSWLVIAAAVIAGAIAGGVAVFVLLDRSDSATNESATRDAVMTLRLAPPPSWHDPALGCSQVRSLERSYGQSNGSPSSEVLWLTQLVNATEVAGATNSGFEGPDVPSADMEVAAAADKLRMVTIGGGLSHPQFPVYLTELLDTCDRFYP